jgi:hypothetical protein
MRILNDSWKQRSCEVKLWNDALSLDREDLEGKSMMLRSVAGACQALSLTNSAFGLDNFIALASILVAVHMAEVLSLCESSKITWTRGIDIEPILPDSHTLTHPYL